MPNQAQHFFSNDRLVNEANDQFMTKMRSPLIGISTGVFLGIALTLSIAGLRTYNKRLTQNQQNWFVCKTVNMEIIAEAIRKYEETNSSSNSLTLQTLVNAKLLPEWSEIYICPGQFQIPPQRSNYDDSFASNIFMPSKVAANYANGSYYIETLSNSFRIRCLYHTNVMDVIIPEKK